MNSVRPALTAHKLEKLISRFQYIINTLNEIKDVNLHTTIDQFYYMQKSVELRLFAAQLQHTISINCPMHEKIFDRYKTMYHIWRHDVRYIQTRMRKILHTTRPNHPLPVTGFR